MVRDPDDVLWRYLEIRARLASPPSQNLVAEQGLIFADTCPRCGRDGRHRISIVKKKAASYRCGACGSVWPAEFAFLLKHEVDGYASRGLEPALADLATLSNALTKLNLRERRLYLGLYLYERVGSYDDVAREANRRYPRLRPIRANRVVAPRWSPWLVRCVVHSGRQKLRAALLAGPGSRRSQRVGARDRRSSTQRQGEVR